MLGQTVLERTMKRFSRAKAIVRCFVKGKWAGAGVVLMVPVFVHAQDCQFAFDPNGNLLTQTAENLTLPQILSQPQPQVVGPDELASFFVIVADARDLTYQWRFYGTNLTSATSDTLLLTNVVATNEGQYSVVLVNGSGSVTSNPAMLWYDSNGNGLPDSWELAHFGNLNQTTTGDSDGDGVSNLQEFLDGTNPTNSASALFRITLLSDGESVSKTPDQATYTNGQSVTLTANPSVPNAFHAWTGEIVTRSNSITLVMTNNKTLFAHFRPITIAWTNLANGDWHSATNWNPNLVPASNDNAVVTISTTINLDGPAECFDLTLGNLSSSPALSGSGSLTLYGASTWTAGTMSGSGQTVIAPGGSLNIPNAGTLSLLRPLENAGTVVWTGVGILNADFGAVITNRTGALFEVQNNGLFYWNASATAPRFDNAGTFRKTTGTGTTTFNGGFPFNNYNAVEIQSGTLLCSSLFVNNGNVSLSAGTTLRLAAGGSASGAFTAPATALVEWAANSFTLNLGALLSGSGLYRINGGSVSCDASLSVQNLDLAATLSGSGTVTVSNVMNWTGGSMSGGGRTIIAPGGYLGIANAGTLSLLRPLENAGTVVWSGEGILNADFGAVITNRTGALFEVQNNGLFYWNASGAAPRFDNAGTFRKTTGTGTTTFNGGFPFNNYNAVEIQSGTLLCNGAFLNNGTLTLWPGTTNRLAASGSANGTFTTPPTALVEWTGGAFNLSPGALLSGSGLYRINGGAVTCDASLLVQNLDMASTLSGSGTVMVSNVMNWTAGTMNGSGRTIISPGATLNIANPSTVSLNTRVLENGGTVLWTGASHLFSDFGAMITNRAGALFEVRNDFFFNYTGISTAPRFDNAGTLRKSASSGTTTFSSFFPLNNYNTVDIRSGIIAANGGYTSSSGAVLRSTLAGTTAGTGFGQLQVAGSVTLNGAFGVGLTNGFVPAVNDSFTTLTAGSRSGAFTSFSFPSNQVSMQLSNTANSVIVRVTSVAVPPPLLLPPVLSFANVLLTWTAVSNITYRLEFNPNLALSNWNAVPGDVTSLGATASKLDALTPSNRFYRVRVLP
jgi:hypothetical protein